MRREGGGRILNHREQLSCQRNFDASGKGELELHTLQLLIGEGLELGAVPQQ